VPLISSTPSILATSLLFTLGIIRYSTLRSLRRCMLLVRSNRTNTCCCSHASAPPSCRRTDSTDRSWESQRLHSFSSSRSFLRTCAGQCTAFNQQALAMLLYKIYAYEPLCVERQNYSRHSVPLQAQGKKLKGGGKRVRLMLFCNSTLRKRSTVTITIMDKVDSITGIMEK
jgi:hypothetical protein